MRRTLAAQMIAASIALGVVLLAIVVSLLVAIDRQHALTERVERAGNAALAATELRSLVVDLQAGQRGYLLTRNERFLEPYAAAHRRWRSGAGARLVAAVGDEGALLRRRIDSLIDDYLAQTIVLFPRDPERVRLMVRSGLGKRRVDVLRVQLSDLIARARQDRRAAFADLRDAEDRATATAVAGIVVAAVLIALFTLYLVRAVVVPVRRVALTARRMSGGDLGARVRHAGRGRSELDDMAAAFNQMAADLADRTAALEERYDAVRSELDRAAELQRRLLPDRPPAVDGLDLAGSCLPAADVGGDYFDFVVDRQGRVTLLVADVAGHGMASALLMAMVRQVVRREIAAGAAPGAVLQTANAELFDDLAAVDLFVTAFCVRIDPATARIEIGNGGHNRPLLRRPDGTVEELDTDGAALGLLPDVAFETRSVAFGDGDVLVLYTDGVVEAEDDAGRPLGDGALRSLAASLDGAPADAGVARIVDAVRGHVRGRTPSDDVTVVVGRRC